MHPEFSKCLLDDIIYCKATIVNSFCKNLSIAKQYFVRYYYPNGRGRRFNRQSTGKKT
jgi:hypothetical protein